MECEQLQEQERRKGKKKKDIVGCKTILLLLFKQDRCDRESGEIAQLCQCCKMTGACDGKSKPIVKGLPLFYGEMSPRKMSRECERASGED